MLLLLRIIYQRKPFSTYITIQVGTHEVFWLYIYTVTSSKDKWFLPGFRLKLQFHMDNIRDPCTFCVVQNTPVWIYTNFALYGKCTSRLLHSDQLGLIVECFSILSECGRKTVCFRFYSMSLGIDGVTVLADLHWLVKESEIRCLVDAEQWFEFFIFLI